MFQWLNPVRAGVFGQVDSSRWYDQPSNHVRSSRLADSASQSSKIFNDPQNG
jgi:hypothetical protein